MYSLLCVVIYSQCHNNKLPGMIPLIIYRFALFTNRRLSFVYQKFDLRSYYDTNWISLSLIVLKKKRKDIYYIDEKKEEHFQFLEVNSQFSYFRFIWEKRGDWFKHILQFRVVTVSSEVLAFRIYFSLKIIPVFIFASLVVLILEIYLVIYEHQSKDNSMVSKY